MKLLIDQCHLAIALSMFLAVLPDHTKQVSEVTELGKTAASYLTWTEPGKTEATLPVGYAV